MKILAIFFDMMGAEYLKYMPHEKDNKLNILLSDLGGTLFDNCFTPAPDTPRSSACMWTGCYPKQNGCDNRLKWPGNFLNKKIDNVWSLLEDYNYDINIYMDKGHELLGLIPLSGNENIYHESIYEFMDNASITDNSFNFFYLPDLHMYMDEYCNTEYGLKKGIREGTNLINNIITKTSHTQNGICTLKIQYFS